MSIIDFHSHILPGADHGSGSVGTSLRQLALMRGANVSAVVATPHFYPQQQRAERFLEKRARCAEELRKALPEDAPAVYLGAEVLVCPGIYEMEGLEKLAIEGTRTLLLEMPTTVWSRELLDTVERLRDGGFHTVMAHIDRYPTTEVQKILARGFAVQLNATAFSGFLGGKKYASYIANGTVCALGSDLHGSDPAGYKPFLKMLKRLGPQADAVFSRTEGLLAGAISLQQKQEMPLPS